MRPIALLAASLLIACEGNLSVELSGTPPESVNQAVLRITAVTVEQEGGGSRRLALDPARDIDWLTLAGGNTVTLLTDEELPGGRYLGATLEIEARSQTLDSFIENADGGQDSIVLSAGRVARASGEFRIRDEESTAITLHLDLRSSLLPGRNAADDRRISPRLRLVESGKAGSISGNVATALLADAGCDEDNDPERGEVVYVFEGRNSALDDLNGLAPEPLTTALITRDAPAADYVAAFLPPGDYTLAVTCQADLDDPNVNDAITFIASANASVEEGRNSTLNFEAQ